MADEQIQVELELDGDGAASATEVQQPQPEAQPQPAGDDPITTLKAQYEQLKAQDDARAKALEEAGRREAEARSQADRATREVAEARTQIADTAFQSVESAISAADGEIQVAKREYAAAMETGDYAKAGDAQEKISAAAARKVGLEKQKVDLDGARKRQTVVLDQPAQQHDPLAGLSAQSRAWVMAHPECISDQEKYLQMVAAHHGAIKAALSPDTPDYFQFIERRLGYLNDDPSPQSQRSRPMPSAPPSREPSSVPGNKVSVNLTEREIKSATDGTLVWNSGPNKGKPIGTQEMARRKALLARDGRYQNISIN